MTADDGLREAIAREYAEFEAAPHEPESWQLDNGEDFAAGVLALPEVAVLRAKAAAADRLLAVWAMTPGDEKVAALRAAFADLHALDGGSTVNAHDGDPGRC